MKKHITIVAVIMGLIVGECVAVNVSHADGRILAQNANQQIAHFSIDRVPHERIRSVLGSKVERPPALPKKGQVAETPEFKPCSATSWLHIVAIAECITPVGHRVLLRDNR